MDKRNDLGARCQIIEVGDSLAKYAEENSKKELKEFYVSKRRYALEVAEKGMKLSRRERKDLSRNLHNANIYLGEY